MDGSPDVTVVTPSYNQGIYIEETIQSVLSQTGVTIEHLVMDAGSTDETQAILERYRDSLDYVSEPDHGQTDAINKGFQRSSGRILAYLNSDDTYLPGAVALAVAFLDSHPECAMVYGEGYHVDPEGRFLERYYTEPFDFQRLAEICFICQPTVFFRRELLATIGYMDQTLHYGMDYDYWIRAAKRYAVGYVPAYLATSKLHDQGKTLSQKVPVHCEIVQIVHRHYGQVPARWIAAYAHSMLEPYLTPRGRFRALAFRLLVHAIFFAQYTSINRRLPLDDQMMQQRSWESALEPDATWS